MHFGVGAEKTDNSDAILAKHIFVFLSCPDLLGRLGGKGAGSQGKRGCFSEAPEQIVCAFRKGAAGNLGGKPKPAGPELPSEAAERGNALKPSPTEKG